MRWIPLEFSELDIINSLSLDYISCDQMINLWPNDCWSSHGPTWSHLGWPVWDECLWNFENRTMYGWDIIPPTLLANGGFRHDDIFTIGLFSNKHFLDLIWYSRQAQLLKGQRSEVQGAKPLPDPHHPNPTASGLRQSYLAISFPGFFLA